MTTRLENHPDLLEINDLEVGDRVLVVGESNIGTEHAEEGIVSETWPGHPFSTIRVDFDASGRNLWMYDHLTEYYGLPDVSAFNSDVDFHMVEDQTQLEEGEVVFVDGFDNLGNELHDMGVVNEVDPGGITSDVHVTFTFGLTVWVSPDSDFYRISR